MMIFISFRMCMMSKSMRRKTIPMKGNQKEEKNPLYTIKSLIKPLMNGENKHKTE
jgi:hypothetical protein